MNLNQDFVKNSSAFILATALSLVVFFLFSLLFKDVKKTIPKTIEVELIPQVKPKFKKKNYVQPKKKNLSEKRKKSQNKIISDQKIAKKNEKSAVPEKKSKKSESKKKSKKYDLKNYKKSKTSPLYKTQDTLGEKIPPEVRQTFHRNSPKKTNNKRLQYSLNTYKWTFQQFVENWAHDLIKWWRAPVDYIAGKVPEGGSVWIKVAIDKHGTLKEYKVYNSRVTSDMELRVIQSMISSMGRPTLPENFPEEELIVYWKFVYPPLEGQVDLKTRK